MKRLSYFLCCIFLLAATSKSEGQFKIPLPLKKVPVSTINYEQGLLSNETASIITDPLGFTWAGTTNGLQRYNGYSLENIDPVIGHDTIRIRSRVYLFRLHNGFLWISYKKGILQYNPFTNVFSQLISFKCLPDDFFGILPLCETPEGIWCLKKGSGMVIYRKDGNLKEFVHSLKPETFDAMINSNVTKTRNVVAANRNRLFIWLDNARIIYFNTTNHGWGMLNLNMDEILGVACNNEFLYTADRFAIRKFRIAGAQPVAAYFFKTLTDQAIAACTFSTIGEDRLMASFDGQVVEFDANLQNPRLLTAFNGKPLLVAGGVDHFYRDEYERIWLVTNDDIKRLQDKEIAFNYLKYPNANNNFVRSLYFDEQTQQLLAGCFGGGLQLYDRNGNPAWPEPLKTTSVKDILAITKLTPGNYLIITWTKGWFLLDAAKRELSPVDMSAFSKFEKVLYDNAFANSFQRLNDSTILVPCISDVFSCVFRGTRLVSLTPLRPFHGSTENWLNIGFLDSKGTLWTGDYKGYIYRQSKNGKPQVLNMSDHSGIRCIAEDAEHNIWVGSNAGLFVFNIDGKPIKAFYKSSGLLNDCIYAIAPQKGKAAVFASTNMGLSEISLNGDIKNYTKELGLQDNEFNTAAAVISPAGKYYFGGVSGITAFYPSALNALKSKATLNMTRLVVNDSTYSEAGIWRGDTVRLKYKEDHLQFDFAALGVLNADKYFYKYRMIGFGRNWQSTHLPTGIRYILQPGTYTLQVLCSSELSGPVVRKNVVIIIDPPFWLRWWFFVIIGFCVIGTVALIVSSYNKRKYQKALQEVMLKQRLQNQREQISRDLHDNLGAQANAIFYGTELLMQKKGERELLIDNLHDTAGDMLTVLRETLWALKITQVRAADLWLRTLNFARKIGNYYPGLDLSIGGTPPENRVLNASLALNMILIIQEAINNAARHSGASVISINSYATDAKWRIEIIDDGKGFDMATVSDKKESYGLENMTERASESGIAFNINSLPSHGTKVYLEIDITKMETQLN
jgi:signal transduction histidine kinase